MFNRYQINKKINFNSIIPFPLLIFDLLNHEVCSLDVNLVKYLLEKLNFFV